MSRLTEAGYISRPHVSAGGVPSDLGYRHYVESLGETPPLPAPSSGIAWTAGWAMRNRKWRPGRAAAPPPFRS